MIAGGADAETILSLIPPEDYLVPGQQYRLAVAGVDADDRKSQFSDPVIVTVVDPTNNNPVFTGDVASRATVGQMYASQVLATDIDGQAVNYALSGQPTSMTISGTGLITWTATSDDIGSVTFDVLLDDLTGGTNQRSFTVYVYDADNRPPKILSQAPALAEPGQMYSYQLIVDDPDAGDTVFFVLIDGPVGATASSSGLVEYAVPAGSGRFDFLVKVSDTAGLFDLQRFSIQADVDAPDLDVVDWGTTMAPAADTIVVEANPAADATGLIDYRLEVDASAGNWQKPPRWSVTGLSPNSEHTLRIKVRDASAAQSESGWSDPLSRYTLAEVPPAPTLVLAEETVLQIAFDPGANPADTELALWSVSNDEWVDLDGTGSETVVWANAATWGTVGVQGLSIDTTYHLRCKARNAEGVETELSEILAVKTAAPDAQASIVSDYDWLVENPVGGTDSQIMLTASFENDPFANSSYTYIWVAHEHAVTGKKMVLVAGGGAYGGTATYAAPERPADDPTPYEITCMITGHEMGNYVVATVEVTVVALVALTPGPEDPPVRKNRYLSFDPNNAGSNVAFQVELTASTYFPGSLGVLGWVGEPFEAPDDPGVWLARVADTAYYSDAWPALVHLGDCEIVPAATYQIRATADGIVFSDPLVISTIARPAPAFWADCVGAMSEGAWTAPNGVVNFMDVNAAVKKFEGDPTAPHLTWVDIEPQEPNAVLNFSDIQQIVFAFQGSSYPFSDPADCP